MRTETITDPTSTLRNVSLFRYRFFGATLTGHGEQAL